MGSPIENQFQENGVLRIVGMQYIAFCKAIALYK
jgi:hypothetical protein